jgi:putative DNA primase/helicase
MARAGFLPGNIEPDTQDFVRFDAPGDKPGRRNGFYKLKLGRFPVGWYGDWKNGEQIQWSWHQSTGQELSTAERAAMKREQARLKAEAAQARETRQAEAAEQASAMWGRSAADVEGHPYLTRKGIDIPRGLRRYTAKDGTQLLAVPMWSFDLNGTPKLTSLQLISDDGDKRFLKAARVEGTFFSLKGDSSIIVICEGVATAFSIWKATGLSVVAAFNAGNLIEVSKEFARHRPLARLLIAADNDEIAPEDWEERGTGKPWVNAGRVKAEAAARAVGCRWILPVFADGPGRDRTDFNDLHLREGDQAVGGQIMGAFRSVEPEDAAPGAQIIEPDFVQDESWRTRIPVTSQGSPDGANVEGVALYISNHKLLRDRLSFNAFTRSIELDGNDLEDFHVAEFRRIMHADRFKSRKPDVADEMIAEARRHSFDPLTDYLGGAKWDGKERIDNWLTDYLGVEQTHYASVVGRKFLIGAVARALDPGCKHDEMLVLEGAQGIGKSTALRYLFGDRFFTDHLPDFHSKDAFIQLQGSWCIEVAELSAMSKADVKDVKQFLSRLIDKFRPPYGKTTVQVGRRCVFAGTVNPEEGGYLRDPTGARRFWPVMCGAKLDFSAILRDRDQLWAEAVASFKLGEKWHLEGYDAELAAKEQDARREIDPWEEVLRSWTIGKNSATIAIAMEDAIKILPDKQTPAIRRRVGACFRALGWMSDVARPGPGEAPAKVFYSPGAWQERRAGLR